MVFKIDESFSFLQAHVIFKIISWGWKIKTNTKMKCFLEKNFLKVNEKQARCHFVNFKEVLPHTTINSKHIRYFKIFRESLAFKVWKQRIVFCVLYTLLSHPQCRTLSSFPLKIENMVVITNRSRLFIQEWTKQNLRKIAF